MSSIVDSKWSLFLKVTELGSVTHAATALDEPQPVVSRRIAVLERECGARLFRRTRRGVTLTDFGQQILPRIQALVAQAEQLSENIRISSAEPMGTVRLGVLPSSVTVFVGALVRLTAQQFPKVQLHLTEGSSVQLEDWLNQGRLDLSLLLRENEAESPDEPTLLRVSLSLLGPIGDPLTSKPEVDFDEVASVPLVLPGEPHLLRARLDALARQRNIRLKINVEADSIHLQEAFVAAGGGYAIVAASALRPEHRVRFSSARIVNPELMRRIVLGTTVLRPHTLATRAVSQLVFEVARTVMSDALAAANR